MLVLFLKKASNYLNSAEVLSKRLSPVPSAPAAGRKKPSPFLKWAGGKTQLISSYRRYFPKSVGNYFEPFLGGGAVFFYLSSTNPGLKATLSDLNFELVNCWITVRDNTHSLIRKLSQHKNDPDYFYAVRQLDPANLTAVERAARLIFLNKTCFNGLYRVNRSGRFNVPFGKYKNPRICDTENLIAVSNTLADTTVSCASFEKSLAKAKQGDFVYLDPPYQPLSSTSSFTSYTRDSFSMDHQRQLADCFESLSRRGCLIMLSNSDTPEIRTLYEDLARDVSVRIRTVKAKRAINCSGNNRGKINELLITNY